MLPPRLDVDRARLTDLRNAIQHWYEDVAHVPEGGTIGLRQYEDRIEIGDLTMTYDALAGLVRHVVEFTSKLNENPT